MTRALWFVPFALLVLLAGWLGWRLGSPMGETEIIEFYVAQYVADHDGQQTDCAARPSNVQGARMEIECRREGGAITYIVGERGALIRKIEQLGPET